MIENFIDRNKDGQPDGGYRGILSLIDAIETENYRTAQILHPAPYKITRLAGRERVDIMRICMATNAQPWTSNLGYCRKRRTYRTRKWSWWLADLHTIFDR